MSDCAMVLCGVVVHCFLYICLLTKFLSYAETADERFIRLLGQTDINIEAHVLANIHETGELSSRMVAASTPDHAMSVYMDAERVPQSHTRAEVLMNSNIRLDGPVPMHGVLKAMFIYAFEENVPLILKVPNLADSARKECALFAQLSDGVKSNGRDVSDYALVPVKLLKLRGEHTATRVSPLKTFNCGILMPIYCMSLDKVPVPIPPQYALQEGERLLEAIQTIHSFGWVHGDIKPHNIFLSNDGRMWLGDYGSSCEKSAINTFSGGTLRYQCNELHLAANNTSNFDIMGLLLSLLDRLGVIELESGPVARNKIMDSINAVTDEELQHFFEKLYKFTME